MLLLQNYKQFVVLENSHRSSLETS